MRRVENCYSDQAAAFVIEDNSVITHFAVIGAGFLLKMDIERVRIFVIVQPHVSL